MASPVALSELLPDCLPLFFSTPLSSTKSW